ncbi:hypothetical protein ABZV31_37805 [Streptomyces sp. NPDC005202]|uniref:hypothetical protein n=1 Tax=Streptomyces sp. NPDC005202 TaxID=3157021 RepID=UPI0033B32918
MPSPGALGEREAYANDLGDERVLIAVSAASIQSKTDEDPSMWLPSAEVYRCRYVTDRVADKTRWGPSVDAAWQTARSEQLGYCPNAPVTAALAR